MKEQITWVLKKFEDISVTELYNILRLRSEVFVVEQNCVYLDPDDKDQECYHFMGWKEDLLAAYTRLVPPGISFEYPSIGRVVTSGLARRHGLGRVLMEKSIEATRKLYGETPIRIGAQVYLKDFYSSLGFVISSDTYIEDGIPHVEMTL